jgi:glycosyltransferase involved in cell wall biosynthesis
MTATGLLQELPLPPFQQKGWPWTIEVEPYVYKKFQQLPLISIIIPSYNQGSYIEETLRSILLQNYSNVEIIVIDGGSTDHTVSIIKKYEKWITYWVSEKDTGQSNAINKGRKLINGQLIGWQNSDDIYLKKTFYHFISAFNKKNDQDVYFGNMTTIDEKSNILKVHYYAPFSFNELKYSGCNITNQSCLFSKEIIKKIELRENYKYAMDGALYFDIASVTNKFMHIRKVLGALRMHSNTKTSSYNEKIGIEEWHQLKKEYKIEFNPELKWSKQYFLLKKWYKIRKAIYYFPFLSFIKDRFYLRNELKESANKP